MLKIVRDAVSLEGWINTIRSNILLPVNWDGNATQCYRSYIWVSMLIALKQRVTSDL